MPQKGKRVLMFSPIFLGYEKVIYEALDHAGYHVDFYDERPHSNFLGKTCIRYDVPFYHPVIKKYYENIIRKNCQTQYDYVFVIKGEAINEEIIALLRKAYPLAEFILYLWDSLDSTPFCKARITKYDRVLTFDPYDAQKYQLGFRPLFCRNEYLDPKPLEEEFKYDIAFVGTAHSDRAKIAKEIKKQCDISGKNCFMYLYLSYRLIFWHHKLMNPDFRTIHKTDIHFTPLGVQEIKEIYKYSRCVLDLEQIQQRGLSMRVFEMLGWQKKLITTNSSITEYDFYRPSNICIVDRNHPIPDKEFLETPYEVVPDKVIQRYSVKQWVCDVFSCEEV